MIEVEGRLAWTSKSWQVWTNNTHLFLIQHTCFLWQVSIEKWQVCDLSPCSWTYLHPHQTVDTHSRGDTSGYFSLTLEVLSISLAFWNAFWNPSYHRDLKDPEAGLLERLSVGVLRSHPWLGIVFLYPCPPPPLQVKSFPPSSLQWALQSRSTHQLCPSLQRNEV